MNNKHFVGKRISSFELYDEIGPITGVALLLDDENEIVAGDETGYLLEVSCPYGTQTMADNILATLQGKVYKGFRAENAILDPAAELGDGVNVNGIYSMLAHRTVTFGPGHMSEISAPGESTMEHEFPWKSPEKKEFDRKLAQTRSLISKTAEEIRLEVAGVEDEISYIQLDLDSITSRVQDAEGNISTLEQTATSLRSEISGKLDSDEAQSLIDQTLDGIELSVSSSGGSTTFKLTADGVTLSTKTLDLTVDAVNISGTLTAGALIGETVGLLTDAEKQAGGLDITGSSSASYAIELWSEAALRLAAYGSYASVWIEAGEAAAIGIQTVEDLGYNITMNRSVIATGSSCYMGRPSYPWAGMYSETDPVITSDRNKKKDISYGLDAYDGFFDGLQSGEYRLKNGTSNRKHWGFMAQDVRDNLDKHGIPTADFGGYVEDVDKDGNPIYGLRYGEFIALLVDQVQKLKARVGRLEAAYGKQ